MRFGFPFYRWNVRVISVMPAALLFLPPLRCSWTTNAVCWFQRSLLLRIIPSNCSFMVIVTPDYSCFVPPKIHYQFVCLHGFCWSSVRISTLINFIFYLDIFTLPRFLDICGVRTPLQCSDVNSIASPVHLPYKGFSSKKNIYLVMKL